MKAYLKDIAIVIAGLAILYAGYSFWNKRAIEPPIGVPQESAEDLVEAGNKTDIPLRLPEGFGIEVFAKNLSGARVMAFGDDLWVSRPSKGVVTKLKLKDGQVISQNDVFRNLKNPHGLAFDPQNSNVLYIAEENRIVKALLNSDAPLEKIADLPSGGGHFTRTIGFGPDDRLYVSIGSSCNVCRENDSRRAAIYSMNKDGSDFKQYASGLRNTVFFDWSYVDGKLWGTDMGRDLLGDNLPPDEVNVIEQDKNYGWPICYGIKIHDGNFDKNQYIRDPCEDSIAPKIQIQAHSAPLGLAFVPEEGWPQEYWYNLIVAYHGSWNRSEPTGYKLVRIILDDKGNYSGTQDFITGWEAKNVLGRPVDVKFHNRQLFVSDDKAGVIYRITAPQ